MKLNQKKWLGMGLAITLLSAPFGSVTPKAEAATGAPSAQVRASSPNKTQHLIVEYKNTAGKQLALKTGTLDHQFKTIQAVSITTNTKGLNKLKTNSNIAYIAKNVTVKTFSVADGDQSFKVVDSRSLNAADSASTTEAPPSTTQDPAQAEESQWDLQAVHATTAWSEGETGKGVKVAVIDTGVGPHTDLKLAGGVSFVTYTKSYNDDNGHGTHVAGTIAALKNNQGMVGIAPDVSLYAVKAMDSNGEGDLNALLEAIDWSIANHMDIINLSLGSPDGSPLFKSMMDKAYSQGILIVSAAGNDGNTGGTGDTMNYPAKYDSVIGVTAVDQSLNRAYFSSTGPTAEVAAPGENVVSTYLKNQYAIGSGTSQAAPHVTGILALLKQAHPTYTNVQLRALLDDFYTKDLGTTGRDPWFGFGLATYTNQTTVMANVDTQAAGAVAKAENQITTANVTTAQTLINLLPTTDVQKSALQTRLNTVKATLALTTDAQTKVAQAQKTLLKTDVDAAQLAVDKLPASTSKTQLQHQLDLVKTTQMKVAQTKLAQAAKTFKMSDMNAAAQAIAQLQDGSEKTKDTQILNLIKQNQLKTADRKTSQAEKVKTRSALNAAESAVSQLPSGHTQSALKIRLSKVETNLMKLATSKTQAAEKSRTKAKVDVALYWVKQLKSGSSKTKLMTRIQKVEAKQMLTAKYDLRNVQHHNTRWSRAITQRAINNLQNTSTKRSLQAQLNRLA